MVSVDLIEILLSEILQNEYKFSSELAVKVCSNFLKRFRQCPDNPEYNLDVWRQNLFHDVLGDNYNAIAGDVYKKWFQLRYHYLNLSPEVNSMLVKLRKKYFLALISNGPSNAQWEKIKVLKLQTYFDVVLILGDLPWEKPSKKIFLKACNYLGVEAHQCIMIGDKIDTDILGGIKSNLGATFWIPLASNYDKNADIVPDFTIDKVTDITNILPHVTSVTGMKRGHNLTVPDLEDSCSNGSDGS